MDAKKCDRCGRYYPKRDAATGLTVEAFAEEGGHQPILMSVTLFPIFRDGTMLDLCGDCRRSGVFVALSTIIKDKFQAEVAHKGETEIAQAEITRLSSELKERGRQLGDSSSSVTVLNQALAEEQEQNKRLVKQIEELNNQLASMRENNQEEPPGVKG